MFNSVGSIGAPEGWYYYFREEDVVVDTERVDY